MAPVSNRVSLPDPPLPLGINSGGLWEALVGQEGVWGDFGNNLEGFVRFWEALAASVRLCKALDALEVFPGKGLGPGFSFSVPFGVLGVWRVSERGRRINFTAFLRV